MNDQKLYPLTPRQARFVQEYLKDCNATAACKRAGYLPDNADVTGPRLLHRPHVLTAIREAQAERAEKAAYDLDDLQNELVCVAFANPRDYFAPGTYQLRSTETFC